MFICFFSGIFFLPDWLRVLYFFVHVYLIVKKFWGWTAHISTLLPCQVDVRSHHCQSLADPITLFFLLYTDFHLLCFSLLRKKGWVDITHILCVASLTRIFIILANFRVEVDSSTTWKLSCWDFCVGGQFYLKNRSMH